MHEWKTKLIILGLVSLLHVAFIRSFIGNHQFEVPLDVGDMSYIDLTMGVEDSESDNSPMEEIIETVEQEEILEPEEIPEPIPEPEIIEPKEIEKTETIAVVEPEPEQADIQLTKPVEKKIVKPKPPKPVAKKKKDNNKDKDKNKEKQSQANKSGNSQIDRSASHVGGYLNNPKPEYPKAALRRNIEGKVTLRVNVNANGSPSQVTIIKSSGFASLDKAAQRTVENQYKFTPALKSGKAVSSIYEFDIIFELRK